MGARGSSSHGGGGPVINGVIGRDPNLHGFRDPDPSYQGAHDAYDYHANNVFDRKFFLLSRF